MSLRQTIRSRTVAPSDRRLALLSLACAILCAPRLLAQAGPGAHGSAEPRGGMMARPRIGHSFAAAPPPPPVRTVHLGLQLGLGGRWWDDGKVGKKLTLRDDQRRRMDDIFEANRPTLQALYTNLQKEQLKLASMPPGDLQDETRVFAAIDRVAQARTDLEKAEAHILVQIRQQLDPGQIEQLDHEIAGSH